MLKHAFAILGLAVALTAQAADAAPSPPSAEWIEACKEWASRLPNVNTSACLDLNLNATDAKSVQGRTIFTKDVAPADANLKVLVLGGIHGDELSSISLAMHWQMQAMSQPVQTHWRFIPLLNPDGALAQPAKRVNAHGVDLNRNFPTPNWVQETKVYWEKRMKKAARYWPGPTPLSEPESRFFNDEIDRFKPNLIVSIHAPFGVLDFDGPGTPISKLGRLVLDQVGVYPGSLGNYAGVHKNIPVVTVELPSSMRTPLNADMTQMWSDLLRWMEVHIRPAALPNASSAIGTATTGESSGIIINKPLLLAPTEESMRTPSTN
jgi:murein peptide amidase A